MKRGLVYGHLAEFTDVKLSFALEAGNIAVFDFNVIAHVNLLDLLVPKRQLYAAGLVCDDSVSDSVSFVFKFRFNFASIALLDDFSFNANPLHSILKVFNICQFTSLLTVS
jgi:hypothetical protein